MSNQPINPLSSGAKGVSGADRSSGRVREPAKRDDFQKVLKDKKEIDADKEDTHDTQPEIEQEKPSPSLFDLSKDANKLQKRGEVQAQATPSGQQVKESILATRQEVPVKKEKTPSTKSESKSSSTTSTSKGEELAAAQRLHPGIGAVNLQTETDSSVAQPAIDRTETVRELVEQLVDAIDVIKRGEQTETRMTLKSPPLLEGATLSLVTSNPASKEFNIAFANLSPEAKLFLDEQISRRSLVDQMQKKGFTVHVVSTTTQPEAPIFTESSQSSQQERQQGGQQQGQEGRGSQERSR